MSIRMSPVKSPSRVGFCHLAAVRQNRHPTVKPNRLTPAQRRQDIDILIVVSHTSSGFLSAFANVQKLGEFELAEHDMFKQLFKVSTGAGWGSPDY
jgi:hypothetical protein